MAKTHWQDPKTSEIYSPTIAGLQQGIAKIEDLVGMNTATAEDIVLSNVDILMLGQNYKIYQVPDAHPEYRNWLSNPSPTIKKNGTAIYSGFVIEYGGGAVIFELPNLEEDVITASFSYIKAPSIPFGSGTSLQVLRVKQDGTGIEWGASIGGIEWGTVTSNTESNINISVSEAVTELKNGLTVNFIMPVDFIVPGTINVNNLGAKTIVNEVIPIAGALATVHYNAITETYHLINSFTPELYNLYQSFINSKSQPNGLASLDSERRIPHEQLPEDIGTVVIPRYSQHTLEENGTTVPVGVSNININKDTLLVFKNSVYLHKGIDYSFDEDNITIIPKEGETIWESGTEFNFICIQTAVGIDELKDALTIVFLNSHYTATSSVTTVPINNNNYNPEFDLLKVFYRQLCLTKDQHYTISPDATSIILTDWTLTNGERIDFEVWKNIRTELGALYDGSLILDQSILASKLNDQVWADILQASLSLSTICVNSVYTVESETEDEIPINISQFNEDKDVILVQYNGVILTKGINYTIKTTWDKILLSDWEAVENDIFHIMVIKNIQKPIEDEEYDGTLLLTGSVTESKLNTGYTNKIYDTLTKISDTLTKIRLGGM